MPPPSYRSFVESLTPFIPSRRIFTDRVRCLTYGTDASFYRLVPQVVIQVESEAEVRKILSAAQRHRVSVTFRAAGTSLSGQAVTDSVLVTLGPTWTGFRISDDVTKISLQPGIIGSHANLLLAPHQRKIGPDPASINAAMIGGIAANNASGMCCGTAQNSYNTLASMRVILADGTLLDTADDESRQAFRQTRRDLVEKLADLASRVKSDTALAERIRRKFRMKNTTGYSINALVDFDDPIDILQHLMIGSEGTLGFIAEVTYRTVPDLPHKATALMMFPDIRTACMAVTILKSAPVDAVELMDRAALRSVESKPGMPAYLRTLEPEVAALLVETRASEADALQRNITAIREALSALPMVMPLEFTAVPAEHTVLWNIRKGLFPSVGAMRATGTTVIIEDVAFPVPHLAQATLDLQGLFRKHGYLDAIIFGHALEGNLHFVFKQDFGSSLEIERYRGFLDDVASLVVRKYDGSLKAEHGTGRNMAPYVELEWGAEAYRLMKDIKQVFDPEGLLNPGVVLNADPLVHVKNLKPMPAAHEVVDKCIECGFCEVQCPSRNLSFTPRQRIVAFREMARLRASRSDTRLLQEFSDAFDYLGDTTCATDGLCATACPVGIDTGTMIKDLRRASSGPTARALASLAAENMAAVTALLRTGLILADGFHRLLGPDIMDRIASLARRLSGGRLPLWNRHLPTGGDRIVPNGALTPGAPTVVYFPTCITRTMGPERSDHDRRSVTTATADLLRKAGFNIVYPENLENLCCGMAFSSKGFTRQGGMKARELERALRRASHDGAFPILADMSPCLHHMRETFTPGLKLYEPVEFILDHVIQRLSIRKLPETIAIHVTCSTERMGLGEKLKTLAGLCAQEVVMPRGVVCCGWAGDRGFTVPELNASALAPLRGQIPPECSAGYSNSRTCEIGLSLHGGIPYKTIVYLVDRASDPSDTVIPPTPGASANLHIPRPPETVSHASLRE